MTLIACTAETIILPYTLVELETSFKSRAGHGASGLGHQRVRLATLTARLPGNTIQTTIRMFYSSERERHLLHDGILGSGLEEEESSMCECCGPARPSDQEKVEPKIREQEKAEKKEPVLSR